MLHLMGIMDIICNITAILSLVYERPEEGTYLPKHVGIVKDHAVKCVCSLYINLVL
jgi:hypothetical protein